MIISVSGYGYSGSGAVIDLLKEYQEINMANETEFEILYCPGGIIYLDKMLNDYCIRFHSSDLALNGFKKLIESSKSKNSIFNRFTNQRFVTISEEYLDSICEAKWSGIVSYDCYLYSRANIRWRYSFARRIEGLIGEKAANKIGIKYKRDIYFSSRPEHFLDKTKHYIEQLLSAAGYDLNKLCLVNQLVPANYSVECFKYFDKLKVIIVDRDPRDLYLSAKYFVNDKGLFIPRDPYDFSIYYRKMRSQENDERVLHVQFEDLIFKYDRTIQQIEQFADVHLHEEKKRYFDPDKSIANTMIFKRYPEYKEEISIIEKELEEYLYRFDCDTWGDFSVPFDW